MKNNLIIFLTVLLFYFCSFSISLNLSLRMNKDKNSLKEDKVVCSCKKFNTAEWKTSICEQSCEDFCANAENENEDLSLCKDRCGNNLCSIVNLRCDISDEAGIEQC